MDFRTTIKPLAHKGMIAHDCAITMLGSCFSDNIGSRLQRALFDVEVNPFGTLYNPASIACGIDAIFPIIRKVSNLEAAMNIENSRKNMINTVFLKSQHVSAKRTNTCKFSAVVNSGEQKK